MLRCFKTVLQVPVTWKVLPECDQMVAGWSPASISPPLLTQTENIYFRLRSPWSKYPYSTACARETHTSRLFIIYQLNLGGFIGIVLLFVFHLFIWQWRLTRSDKTRLEGTFMLSWWEDSHPVYRSCTHSSALKQDLRFLNIGPSTKSPEVRVTSSFAIYLSRIWGLGSRSNYNGCWQEEIGTVQGVRGGLLLPVCWASEPLGPFRHQGARACQAWQIKSCPRHLVGLSPDQPSPCWVTCLHSLLSLQRSEPGSSPSTLTSGDFLQRR